ncbi:MAG TPA: arsenate reductase ArsC [Ignavibacteriaceae bacterium]|nr:arsenate reductase ArsC [Ignavibacteriaceae bacterium]
MMEKLKVLFVCIHNSARSQMAEAYLKKYGSDNYEVESAGIEPGKLNPIVVEVMKEDGIDISGNRTKDVFEFFKQGKVFHYVITVCDKEAAERCPIFPGIVKRLHWGFPDPSSLQGTPEEKLNKTRDIRETIKQQIKTFINEIEKNK